MFIYGQCNIAQHAFSQALYIAKNPHLRTSKTFHQEIMLSKEAFKIWTNGRDAISLVHCLYIYPPIYHLSAGTKL